MDGHQAIPAVLDIKGLPVQIGLTPGESMTISFALFSSILARHFEAGRLVEMLRPFTSDDGNGAPRTIEFCLTPKTLEHYLLAA
jgi:hypothetical protein